MANVGKILSGLGGAATGVSKALKKIPKKEKTPTTKSDISAVGDISSTISELEDPFKRLNKSLKGSRPFSDKELIQGFRSIK